MLDNLRHSLFESQPGAAGPEGAAARANRYHEMMDASVFASNVLISAHGVGIEQQPTQPNQTAASDTVYANPAPVQTLTHAEQVLADAQAILRKADLEGHVNG